MYGILEGVFVICVGVVMLFFVFWIMVCIGCFLELWWWFG